MNIALRNPLFFTQPCVTSPLSSSDTEGTATEEVGQWSDVVVAPLSLQFSLVLSYLLL